MIERRTTKWREFRFSLGTLLLFTALSAGSSLLVTRTGFVSSTILVPFWASVIGAVATTSFRQRIATAGIFRAIGGAVGLYLMVLLSPPQMHLGFPSGIPLAVFISSASGAVLGLVIGMSYDFVVRLRRRPSRSRI